MAPGLSRGLRLPGDVADQDALDKLDELTQQVSKDDVNVRCWIKKPAFYGLFTVVLIMSDLSIVCALRTEMFLYMQMAKSTASYLAMARPQKLTNSYRHL